MLGRMPSPFPGMDPYLEHRLLWPDVHNALVAAIRNALAPRLRPRYVVCLEERTYLAEPDGVVFVGRPDVTVRERAARKTTTRRSPPARVATVSVEVPMPDQVRETWLEVRSVDAGDVVTVLELLSASNKASGPDGRRRYEAKRLAILGSPTHLVEIDLLRAGTPMTIYGADSRSDYRILVSRGDRRPRAELLAFSVRDAIPPFELPLRAGDDEPTVELGPLLGELYDTAGYDLRIDYRADPEPPLSPDDRAWAADLLRARRA
jgi:hypothetical protein